MVGGGQPRGVGGARPGLVDLAAEAGSLVGWGRGLVGSGRWLGPGPGDRTGQGGLVSRKVRAAAVR